MRAIYAIATTMKQSAVYISFSGIRFPQGY